MFRFRDAVGQGLFVQSSFRSVFQEPTMTGIATEEHLPLIAFGTITTRNQC
jgi:hypothetical protein